MSKPSTRLMQMTDPVHPQALERDLGAISASAGQGEGPLQKDIAHLAAAAAGQERREPCPLA